MMGDMVKRGFYVRVENGLGRIWVWENVMRLVYWMDRGGLVGERV